MFHFLKAPKKSYLKLKCGRGTIHYLFDSQILAQWLKWNPHYLNKLITIYNYLSKTQYFIFSSAMCFL